MGGRKENLGCLGVFLKLLGGEGKSSRSAVYRVRDDFLSEGEIAFYRALHNAVGRDLAIFAKVRLGDVLFTVQGEGWQAANNRIMSKHVDFLLCHPNTFKIVAAVELDDKSHKRADRGERDEFIANAFKAAGIPLLRFPAKAGYDSAAIRLQVGAALDGPARAEIAAPSEPVPTSGIPDCPKCALPMVLRRRKQGGEGAVGEQFWGCRNYPRCREMRTL